jgi:hypothetical protein
MGKRGPKPKGKVKIKWSANFAYAIGLLATDGCLSPDGRHIELTSSDIDQLENFNYCLGLKMKIGSKKGSKGVMSSRIQFGDVLFCRFLEGIGLSQAKSLTLGKIDVPKKYFFDFLRGCFDGDGSSYSYWDLRWKSSFMFYIEFSSGSINFINWTREEIKKRIGICGHITSSKKKNPCYQLKYAKYEGIKLVREIYRNKNSICLKRKKLKINESLGTIGVPKMR